MKFANPEYWIWFLGLPVSLGILYLVYKRVSQITHTWFSPDQFARSYPFLKMILRGTSFALLFVALVGPYWGQNALPEGALGREFYVLLDVSASMNAEDIKPSRLDRIKRELRQLINKLQGDRIGLIVFSENAYVMCPLTQDYQALQLFLDMVSTDQFAQTGTQFRSALAAALERFVHTPQGIRSTSRAAILISDGEDFGDTYASIIERMKQADIEVFTLGVGTYEGAPIPQLNEGRKVGYKRYDDGTMVISRLIDGDLIAISEEFGTDYVRLDEQTDNLSALERQIYSLRATPFEARMEQVANNRYQAVLYLAVMLLFTSLFLMPVRKI